MNRFLLDRVRASLLDAARGLAGHSCSGLGTGVSFAVGTGACTFRDKSKGFWQRWQRRER